MLAKRFMGRWRMPWVAAATKDVGCLRKAAGRWLPTCDPQMSEWGNPTRLNTVLPCSFRTWGEPAEVKHLSKRRKRKKSHCLTMAHSLSSGERRGKSLNLPCPSDKEIPNHKHQIPNKFQILIFKIQNPFWSLKFRSLELICDLEFAIWDFLVRRARLGVVRR